MKLSHSRLNKLKRCPKKYYWQYCQNLVRREKRPELSIGSAFHEGHKKWFHPTSMFMDLTDRVKATKDFVDEACRKENLSSEQCGQVQRLVSEMMRATVDMGHLSVIATEQWIEVPFSAGVTYVVRADGIALDNNTGELSGLEAKTTSGIGTNYLNSLRYGPQSQGTIWALRQSLKKPVGAMWFHVVTKAKNPQLHIEKVVVNERQQERWQSATGQWARFIQARDPSDPDQWEQNDEACWDIRFGECEYNIIEKFGLTANVLELFEPYHEGPAFETDGGI